MPYITRLAEIFISILNGIIKKISKEPILGYCPEKLQKNLGCEGLNELFKIIFFYIQVTKCVSQKNLALAGLEARQFEGGALWAVFIGSGGDQLPPRGPHGDKMSSLLPHNADEGPLKIKWRG